MNYFYKPLSIKGKLNKVGTLPGSRIRREGIKMSELAQAFLFLLFFQSGALSGGTKSTLQYV